jgi:hypothetical protein
MSDKIYTKEDLDKAVAEGVAAALASLPAGGGALYDPVAAEKSAAARDKALAAEADKAAKDKAAAQKAAAKG